MSYLKFDKTQLVNLEYSLPRELLLSNGRGFYCSTTIIGCNTRKYHGLLVGPMPSVNGGKHVILSTIHDTVIQHGQEFNLGINKYPGEYHPNGHKYARWFENDPIPKIVYRIGGVVLQKELLLVENDGRLLIRYTLLNSASPTRIRIKPFLAFRGIHDLSKANLNVNRRLKAVENGFSSSLYPGYPALYLQCSKKVDFVTAPDWYRDVEYNKEGYRGYDFHEDLFVPGYFETGIKMGESIVVSAGMSKTPTRGLTRLFKSLAGKIEPREGLLDWLKFSAQAFICRAEGKTEIIPGYHWFGHWGRHSMISLPGISLAVKDKEFAINVIDSLVKMIRGGMLPDHSPNSAQPVYGSADTSLWFFWLLQKLSEMGHDAGTLYQRYRNPIKKILSAYINSDIPGIEVHENGLLHAYLPDRALTWMDSYVGGLPVTQRPGYAIEVNGLWYNALSFAIKGAEANKDKEFTESWKMILSSIDKNFDSVFWDEENKALYDYVFRGEQNRDVRPNMLIAASMSYTPLTGEQIKAVLDKVRQELLVPRGVRSLSPRSADFRPTYEGPHDARDLAYHQGTVWPWLIGPFAESWLRINEKSGAAEIQNLLLNFECDLLEHGIGMISEVYDGNPPHRACGAISFSSSVGELLRVNYLLTKFDMDL